MLWFSSLYVSAHKDAHCGTLVLQDGKHGDAYGVRIWKGKCSGLALIFMALGDFFVNILWLRLVMDE